MIYGVASPRQMSTNWLNVIQNGVDSAVVSIMVEQRK
jgi:hypothetical protein